MTTFFTSDTHFGDHRAINISRRPFPGAAGMDAALIERWNAMVGPGDEVWHLGDVARRPGDVAALLGRLSGIKHLLRGNNDPPATLEAEGWASVGDYRELELDGYALVLCHYPFRTWNGQYRGSINLHGHSHGRLKTMPRQFDVGVDVRDSARDPEDAARRGGRSGGTMTGGAFPIGVAGMDDAGAGRRRPAGGAPPPETPDGRYIVVRGRLWRRANPRVPEERRMELVALLMDARRAVGRASRAGDPEALAVARRQVDAAKVALGERGPVWWGDGAPDLNRRMARNTSYADWYAAAEDGD